MISRPLHIINIPTPQIFSFDECAWFLDRNYDDCMHSVVDNKVYKAIEIDGAVFLLKLDMDGNQLVAEVLQGEITPGVDKAIINYVVDWFDLERDISPFYDLLRKEPGLAYMADEYAGLRLIGIPDLFEALCWSITGQQINLSFAFRLKRRLVEKYGTPVIDGEDVYYLFPRPETLAGADIDDMREMQFSRGKADYLISTAKAFASGEISKEKIEALPDFEAKHQALVKLRGIGTWTANYVLMKSLRLPNGIPHGDTGLLTALQNHGIITDRTQQDKIDALFLQFKGWESYLVFYLWRGLARR